jgi:alanine dehydrogenase
MPAVVARTATLALTNAVLPYVQEVCEEGIVKALLHDPGLGKGVCTYKGVCTNEVIAKIFDFKPQAIELLLRNS